jgi:hypothetical protein
MYCFGMMAAPATRIATRKLVAVVDVLHTVNVEHTADVDAGTVYKVVNVVTTGSD